MFIINKIYTVWCLFWFLAFFFALYPFMRLFLLRKPWYEGAHLMNRIWSFSTMFMCLLPYKRIYKAPLDKKKSYIYCPNHTSYLDIPVMYAGVPNKLNFIAKSSLSKVPLFGYMYKKLHINVDRESSRSKYDSFHQSAEAVDNGRSVIIFPEGTIPQKDPPRMLRFKDGAFKIAIQKQIPIVPVTIPYNWIILQDSNLLAPKRHKVEVIFHEPIETAGMTLDDMVTLKQQTFDVIQNELKIRNNLS